MNTTAAGRLFLAAALGLAMCGCRAASSRYVPSGKAAGAGPGGQSAAFYQYVSPDPRKGQAQVWCDGRRDAGFQFGVRLRNDGAGPLVLSPSMSTLRYPDMDSDMKARETSDVSVAPGKISEILLHFPCPERFSERLPADVTFTWVVKAGGKVFREATDFSVETGHGFVPRPLNSSADPLDRQDMDRPRDAGPVGIPVGPDATSGQ